MQKTILSDTGCLIFLEKIGELELLHRVFGEILVTRDAADEYESSLPEWISVRNPADKNYQKILAASVDKSQASTLALAVELDDCLLMIDDLKGRNLADALGVRTTGTLGLILHAKRSGLIEAISPIVAKIKQTDFRLPGRLESKILATAGE